MNILVIGPHPDDQEIGMGGAIALFAEQGHNVLLLDMTDGSPTPHGDRATRLPEAAAAAKALSPTAPGSAPVRRLLLDLPNRRVEHTIDARHKVAGVIRAHQAQVLFMPHPQDAHPDHLAVTRIAQDARFDAKLTKVEMPVPPGYTEIGPPIYPKWVIYYYCSHLRRVPDPTFILDTSTMQARKRAAIAAYVTQFGDHTHNAGLLDRFARDDAYFGSRIGVAAGEPFWMLEPLGLTGLEKLA
ncbi:MAG: bacillithiol biosynthesis deacetylase BshB1 [Tepidisphaera sp.]|nr:bacillithiol biosynthesis deacetylase BshB1 [Tepidisphaera sp.]